MKAPTKNRLVNIIASASVVLFVEISVTIMYILCINTPIHLDRILVYEYIGSWIWGIIMNEFIDYDIIVE